MTVLKSKFYLGTLLAAGAIATAFAGPEMPPPAQGSTEGTIEVVGPTPAAGIPYFEYFNYSAYAKRSYVPGYTPHVTSLYENPRDYPWALCVLATPYYRYAGTKGWFFGSPQGYQSSVPPGSHASKYYRGELGITANLRGGYAQGMRVVEPAIVPVGSSVERGGVYIHGADTTLVNTTVEETVQTEALAKSAPPPALPVPVPEK
jgi:hypothetical protein